MENRVLHSVEIMRAIVDRIGCKLNVFNEDGVYRRHRYLLQPRYTLPRIAGKTSVAVTA